MFFIIGFIIVLGSVGIGYGAHGGSFAILWQPLEVLIILGSGIGAFIIGNPSVVIKRALGGFKKLMRGAPYKKKDYLDVLTFMFKILKQIKTKGMLTIEGDIENPKDSQFFQPYPVVLHNHGLLDMFCDTVRLMTMGMENEYQIEDLLTAEVDAHHHDLEEAASAITGMADGLPALGIVAAVLGVITTMGIFTQPPEVLGHLIGAALVGTFLGVLMSYGVVSPMGSFLAKYANEETAIMNCMKTALIYTAKGAAPVIACEVARKSIPEHLRPSFQEAEKAMNGE